MTKNSAGARLISSDGRSDAEDGDTRAESFDNRSQVVLVRGEDSESPPMGDGDDMNVDHVSGASSACQRADVMCIVLEERHEVAAAEESPKLRLSAGPTHLGDDRSGRDRHGAKLKAGAVVRPNLAIGPIGGDESAGVVDDGHADRLRARRGAAPICEATRPRAAASSASLNAPCSASHSATAARPSRVRSARRAAFVIHAETLTPSASAASTTWSRTSGSTVMASFGDGFPLGMR